MTRLELMNKHAEIRRITDALCDYSGWNLRVPAVDLIIRHFCNGMVPWMEVVDNAPPEKYRELDDART
jgi:hypothetical protein